jgi:hypothetical protein
MAMDLTNYKLLPRSDKVCNATRFNDRTFYHSIEDSQNLRSQPNVSGETEVKEELVHSEKVVRSAVNAI